jgi:HK97 gp10 family phage protein
MADKINLKLTVSTGELKKALAQKGLSAERVLEAAMVAAGKLVESEAQERLTSVQDAISQETINNAGKSVDVHIGPKSEKWYARFFETGTRPHLVTPKNAGALRWYDASGAVIQPVVNVEGIPARPFLRPAVDENINDIRDEAGKVLKRAID